MNGLAAVAVGHVLWGRVATWLRNAATRGQTRLPDARRSRNCACTSTIGLDSKFVKAQPDRDQAAIRAPRAISTARNYEHLDQWPEGHALSRLAKNRPQRELPAPTFLTFARCFRCPSLIRSHKENQNAAFDPSRPHQTNAIPRHR